MTNSSGIKTAEIDWKDGAPRSALFGDIYFSGDGPAETVHVFLAGNGLPARFENAARFSIGELGFGTGLNFLVAWDAFLKAKKPAGARLDFYSVEAFPLNADDLAKAHDCWPALAPLSEKLRRQWPPLFSGFHRLALGDGVTLTLFIGDALAGLRQTEASIDAWFLDGFAPDRNPEMWGPELMRELARVTAPQGTFATFTVAGAVRRALADAGFALEKTPGYGRKREMLAGRIDRPTTDTPRKPWFDTRRTSRLKKGARIAVIGAGIAGASAASHLRQAGFDCAMFETTAPASGASGNPAGLIMPRLDADDSPSARFHAQSYLYTVQLLSGLGDLFNPCGVLLHATSDHERRRQEKLLAMSALPAGWMKEEGDGLFFPQGGVVDPASFVRALLGDTPVINERVGRLARDGESWRIETAAGVHQVDAIVIANSLDALRFAQARSLPLTGSAGQIDWFENAPPPLHVHAFGPYAAPAPNGGLVIGATYAPVAIGVEPGFTKEATQTNLEAIARRLPDLVTGLSAAASRPRASVRCTTPDRLPIAGPVPDWGFYSGAYDGLREGRKGDYPPGESLPGFFILTGLGSRGLVTAPLLGAMLAAELSGAPSPVAADIAEALHPARFFIRDLKRSR